jgi:hypothetical protein
MKVKKDLKPLGVVVEYIEGAILNIEHLEEVFDWAIPRDVAIQGCIFDDGFMGRYGSESNSDPSVIGTFDVIDMYVLSDIIRSSSVNLYVTTGMAKIVVPVLQKYFTDAKIVTTRNVVSIQYLKKFTIKNPIEKTPKTPKKKVISTPRRKTPNPSKSSTASKLRKTTKPLRSTVSKTPKTTSKSKTSKKKVVKK